MSKKVEWRLEVKLCRSLNVITGDYHYRADFLHYQLPSYSLLMAGSKDIGMSSNGALTLSEIMKSNLKFKSFVETVLSNIRKFYPETELFLHPEIVLELEDFGV